MSETPNQQNPMCTRCGGMTQSDAQGRYCTKCGRKWRKEPKL